MRVRSWRGRCCPWRAFGRRTELRRGRGSAPTPRDRDRPGVRRDRADRVAQRLRRRGGGTPRSVVVDRAFVRYTTLLAEGRQLRDVAREHLSHWRRILNAVPDAEAALVVFSGGSIEPVLVAAFPDADHAGWGGALHHLEGGVDLGRRRALHSHHISSRSVPVTEPMAECVLAPGRLTGGLLHEVRRGGSRHRQSPGLAGHRCSPGSGRAGCRVVSAIDHAAPVVGAEPESHPWSRSTSGNFLDDDSSLGPFPLRRGEPNAPVALEKNLDSRRWTTWSGMVRLSTCQEYPGVRETDGGADGADGDGADGGGGRIAGGRSGAEP